MKLLYFLLIIILLNTYIQNFTLANKIIHSSNINNIEKINKKLLNLSEEKNLIILENKQNSSMNKENILRVQSVNNPEKISKIFLLKKAEPDKEALKRSIITNNNISDYRRNSTYSDVDSNNQLNESISNNITDKGNSYNKNKSNLRKKFSRKDYNPNEYEDTNIAALPYNIPNSQEHNTLEKFNDSYPLEPNISNKLDNIYNLLGQTDKSFDVAPVIKKKGTNNCNLNKIDFTIKRKIQKKPECYIDEVYDPILRLCINVDCIPYDDISLFG